MSDDLKQAIGLYKRGNKEQCLQVVRSFLKSNPRSERGWLLAANCIEDENKQRRYYRRVLQINPDNKYARKALKPWAKRRLESEIERHTANGWQVKSRTEESVQLVKPKKADITPIEVLILIIAFAGGIAFPPLLILAAGGLIYIGIKYFSASDKSLYLSVERIMRPEKQSTGAKDNDKPGTFKKLILIAGGLLAIFCIAYMAIGLLLTDNQDSEVIPTKAPSPTEDTVYPEEFVDIFESWDCSHDGIGNMIFEGKVRNTGSRPLTLVELRATVYTEEGGEVVNTNTGFIDSDILLPEATGTFRIYVDDPDNAGTYCGIKVESAYFD